MKTQALTSWMHMKETHLQGGIQIRRRSLLYRRIRSLLHYYLTVMAEIGKALKITKTICLSGILCIVCGISSCNSTTHTSSGDLPIDEEAINKVPVIDSVQTEIGIKMINKGGVYELPCSVNGVKMNFIFDTGASDVSISTTEANFLYKNGYLHDADIIGESYSTIADGSIVENIEIKLNSIVIGGVRIEDVNAIVVNSKNAPLLLGLSVLKRFGSVRFSNDSLFITSRLPQHMIENAPSVSDSIAHTKKKPSILKGKKRKTKVDSLLNMADRYYREGLIEISNQKFREAEKLCKRDFRSYGLKGHYYFTQNEYNYAIGCFRDYLERNKSKESFTVNNRSYNYSDMLSEYAMCEGEAYISIPYAEEALQINPQCSRAYNALVVAYIKLKKYDLAERWAKRAQPLDEALSWFLCGLVYKEQGRASEAIKAFKNCLEFVPDSKSCLHQLADTYSFYYEEQEIDGKKYPPFQTNKYYETAVALMKKSAALGNESSQEWLRNRGYEW